MRNLKSLCQRCHLIHDRSHHMARRRITYLLRRAIGDLFFGLYSACSVLEEARKPLQTEAEGHNGTSTVTRVGQRPQARRFAAPFGAMGLDRAVQQGSGLICRKCETLAPGQGRWSSQLPLTERTSGPQSEKDVMLPLE